jgi:non-ribosomal peptide synthetase component E (peptide arylation enzyme)
LPGQAPEGAHQAPKSVDMVERLPVTPVGKIDKKALREPYGQGRQEGALMRRVPHFCSVC